MRKTEGETKEKKRGQCFAERLAVIHQSEAAWCPPSHSPWLFLPKCCFFDQANITEKKTGMQTLRGG